MDVTNENKIRLEKYVNFSFLSKIKTIVSSKIKRSRARISRNCKSKNWLASKYLNKAKGSNCFRRCTNVYLIRVPKKRERERENGKSKNRGE